MRDYLKYRKIWEEANGKKIPVGYHIHHKDGNRNNNSPSNLMCVSPWEHYLIHKNKGDNWAAAMLLKGILGTNKSSLDHHYWNSIPHKDSKALKDMTNGLIRVPRYKKLEGFKEPEVELNPNMDFVEAREEYVEKDFSVLYKELDLMKPKAKKIIMMKYGLGDYDPHTYREICEKTGYSIRCGEDTVRMALSRIRKKMKNNSKLAKLYFEYRP